MPTLLDLLYQYAQEQRMGAALSAAGPDFRAACRLAEKARTELEGLLEEQRPASLRRWLEARNILTTARVVLAAALIRQESRGAHYRQDYPETSAEWQGSIYISTAGNYFIPAR